MSKQKTIKLTEEAVKLYNTSSDKGFKELLENTFGKDFYKPKSIESVVVDLKSLESYLGYSILIFSRPKTAYEKYISACAVLAKVAEVYNEGTVLDWKNTDVYKYMPYKYTAHGSFEVCSTHDWSYCRCASGCLYYKNSKLSTASYNNFKEYWEDYWGLD